MHQLEEKYMIKSWFNTIATQLAGMIEVSDEKIIQYSNGEVNRTTWDTENDLKTGTIIDPVIFGDLARENMSKISSEGINKLGHIALPIAVVNIQYMRGRKPVLVKELGMKLPELEDIVYGRTYIPADADCSRAISVSEYMKVSNSKKEDYLTGGEAVSKMMERKQVPKEIKDAAVISVFQYAVHSVPQAAELMFEHAKENGVGGFHPENEEHIAFYIKCVKDIEQGIANAATLYIKKQLRFAFA